MNLGIFLGLSLLSSVTSVVNPPQLSRPVIRNVMGRFLNHPGLSFQPRPDPRSTLIRFNKGRPSTFQPYVDALKASLSAYRNENQQTEKGDMIDCAMYNEYRPTDTWSRPCRFDLLEVGPNCVEQQSFGYEDGQPCVMFNLERVFRWLPTPYENSTVPGTIRDLWSEYYVTLKCEGKDATSRDNMGELSYYPRNGFHFKYFPNMGQPNWIPPLVFVRFDNPAPAILVRVECKVYADNIWHNRTLNTGMISFEMLVD